jgi:hypothetical protein
MPFLISNVQSSDLRKLRLLSPLELDGLRKSGTYTVLFLPHKYQDKDYVLMLCFSEVMELQQEIRDALWSFCKQFVDKYENSQSGSRNFAIMQLEELLMPEAQVNRETMDKVAEIIRKTVYAGGISIFLCSEDRKKLQLVGSSPGIEGDPPYENVYYLLENGQGLTPEVVLSNRVFRYSDLEDNLVKEELAVRGYTWMKRWPEALEYESYQNYPFMAVPIGNRLGVIRASCRERSECSFTAQDEETLYRIADLVASFVNKNWRTEALRSNGTQVALSER